MAVPKYEQYMNPTLKVLRELGGSATVQELNERVIEDLGLTEEQVSILHNPDRGNQTEVAYRMAWTRTYLKKAGYIDNSKRGVWALTKQGRETDAIDPYQISQQVREAYIAQQRDGSPGSPEPEYDEEISALDEEIFDGDWRSQLMETLLEMPPDAFERLAQRLLRECGFIEVNVLGRTGDGGIDGTGILRLQYLVSFQILFQCKRWRGTVGAREIRDFRGAMVGRTDKGLFITTGLFSREAQKEATRDGAPTIDLIDGDQLLDLLKKLELGVRTEVVEKSTVDQDWFHSL
jgi:restriction system protein